MYQGHTGILSRRCDVVVNIVAKSQGSYAQIVAGDQQNSIGKYTIKLDQGLLPEGPGKFGSGDDNPNAFWKQARFCPGQQPLRCGLPAMKYKEIQ